MTGDGQDDLETFVKEYEYELRRSARRLVLGHGVDADELYSATCLGLVRCWPPEVRAASRLPWTIGFMFNTMRDLRKAQSRRSRWVDGGGIADAREPEAPPWCEPESAAMASTEEREIARLIAGLAREFDREVVSLRFEGWTLREIAEHTGEGYGRVRVALERARGDMRGRYGRGERE